MPSIAIWAEDWEGNKSKLVIKQMTEAEMNGLVMVLGTIADHMLDEEEKEDY